MPVVVGASGQPAHQPAAAFGTAQLSLDGGGIGVAILSQCFVDQAHRVWVGRVAAAGLVEGEENLGTTQGGNADIFANVGVICLNLLYNLTFDFPS